MAFLFEQATGHLYDVTGKLIEKGYAGRDLDDQGNQVGGKNNPAMQTVKGIGPLPCGLYSIMPPRTSTVVGKYAMPLVPDSRNEMFGRSSFFMHGDSKEHPGLASHGCTVVSLFARMGVWSAKDHQLRVFSGVGEDTLDKYIPKAPE